MRARALGALGVLLAVGACTAAAPQTATVTMDGKSCVMVPAGLRSGRVVLTVRNVSTRKIRFVVVENNGGSVGSVTVGPRTSPTLPVDLDHGDHYLITCGAIPGATITP